MKKLLVGFIVLGSLFIGMSVFAESIPRGTLISPESESFFTPGETVEVKWNKIEGYSYQSASCNSCFIKVIIKRNNVVVKEFSNIENDGKETIKIPPNTPAGEYQVFLYWNNYSMGPNSASGERLVGTFHVLSSSSPSCKDTDYGDFPFVSGSVTLAPGTYSPGTTAYQADKCYSSLTNKYSNSCTGEGCQVMENMCVDLNFDGVKDTYNSHYTTCSNGCSNGACLKAKSNTAVKVLSPNGGEEIVPGEKNIISWKGGIEKVYVGLIRPDSELQERDIEDAFIGWIKMEAEPNSSVIWDGINLITEDGSGPITFTEEGVYKILVVSEKEDGDYCIETYEGADCNFDLSDRSFNIKPTSIDKRCSKGEVYNSTTGKLCSEYYITLVSPKSDTSLIAGESINVKWNSKLPELGRYSGWRIKAIIKYNDSIIKEVRTANDGEESIKIPASAQLGKYEIEFGATYDSSGGEHYTRYGVVNFNVISHNSKDLGCFGSAKFSSTTGKVCPGTNNSLAAKVTQCLIDKGAILYGASWCSYCQAQKKLFESYADSVPYVECSNSEATAENTVCKEAKITSYPTWRFKDGTELTGTQSLAVLAKKVGCSVSATPIRRTLKQGLNGDDVRALQSYLQIEEDGVFGKGTAQKVREWQRQNGLKDDGVFGLNSRQKAGME